MCVKTHFWKYLFLVKKNRPTEQFRRMKKKKHAEDQLDLDGHAGTSAFPESPSAGGTIRGTGLTTQGNRDRGRSGHFPIPRFDSIRGRFDSGIFASNTGGQANNNGTINGGGGGGVAVPGTQSGDLDKIDADRNQVSLTAQSTPSGLDGGSGGGGSSGGGKAPRSTVLDERLVAQGYTTSDVGRPLSAASGASRASGAAGRQQAAGWGLAMSGEYPDLEGADPYVIDNAMADKGTGGSR